jgi:hypothetical protein
MFPKIWIGFLLLFIEKLVYTVPSLSTLPKIASIEPPQGSFTRNTYRERGLAAIPFSILERK